MPSPNDEHALLQAIRRGHCSDTERDHDCVGEIRIGPKGYTLHCARCGTGEETIAYPARHEATRRTIAVLRAAGLDYDRLAPETQRRAVNEMVRKHCPKCGVQIPCTEYGRDTEYHRCACGMRYWRGTWREDDA